LQQALPSGVELRAKAAQALVAALETRLAERLEAAEEAPAEPAAPPPATTWRKRFLNGGLPWRR
jgi:hypothetical protein